MAPRTQGLEQPPAAAAGAVGAAGASGAGRGGGRGGRGQGGGGRPVWLLDGRVYNYKKEGAVQVSSHAEAQAMIQVRELVIFVNRRVL